MTHQELDDEQQAIVRKVEKLLALASRKKGNEEEAANAAARAQEMLTAYNIDMAIIEQGSSNSGKREQAKKKGGAYLYQRDLWQAVAELNFCMYWTHSYYHKREVTRKDYLGKYTEIVYGLRHQHRVVGRQVNVRSTEAMAEYLEQTIERLVMGRLGDQNNMRFSRWAVSYRKGAAARIIEKIQDRRRELEEAEAQKLREAQHRAERAGVSTSTSVTIADVRKTEREANIDHRFGEGTSARWAEQRRKAAEAAAKADAEYAQWAAANPEEARKEEDKRRKREEKQWARYSKRRTKADNVDSGAYWEGYDKANDVGIDPQTSDRTKTGALIG